MECKYCNTIFSTKSNLLQHQRGAKYCIDKQNGNTKDKQRFICIYCHNSLSSKQMLNIHHTTCLDKYKHKIDEMTSIITTHDKLVFELLTKITSLESKLEVYEKQETRAYSTVERIAEQPKNVTSTSTTNNKILIMTPLDMDVNKFKEAIENGFTSEYLLQGQRGVAQFAYNNLLTDENGDLKYACSDPSRHIYQYKNPDGDIERDVKAKKLTKALLDANLTSKSHAISIEKMNEAGNSSDAFMLYTQNWQDIKDMEEDNGVFRAELTALTTK